MSDEPSDTPPPKLKLQRPSQPQQSEKAKTQLTPPPESPTLKAPAPKLAPKVAANDSIKAGEIQSPPAEPVKKATPPPLKKPAPSPAPKQEIAPGLQNRLDERPPQGVDQLLQQSLKASEAPPSQNSAARSSVTTSIALIIVLMLILGGGGYAVWEMFIRPEAASESSEATITSTAAAEPKNPIDRAKAAIDKVPTTDIDALTGETPDSPEPVEAAQAAAAQAEPAPTTEATQDTPTVDTSDLRNSVSGFLSTATVGMVRTGANARVMLNNENYRIGDEVDPTTGLIFLGTKSGKLVFKDRNEVTYHKSF